MSHWLTSSLCVCVWFIQVKYVLYASVTYFHASHAGYKHYKIPPSWLRFLIYSFIVTYSSQILLTNWLLMCADLFANFNWVSYHLFVIFIVLLDISSTVIIASDVTFLCPSDDTFFKANGVTTSILKPGDGTLLSHIDVTCFNPCDVTFLVPSDVTSLFDRNEVTSNTASDVTSVVLSSIVGHFTVWW